MATITVRNLNKRVAESLKKLARRKNCSMEQLVRNILEEKVASKKIILNRIKKSWKANRYSVQCHEIEEWIKQIRERDV